MIYTNLLNNDLYKFTMMQIVFHQFKDEKAEYRLFRCNENFTDEMVNIIQREIEELCSLRFKVSEIDYLRSLGYFEEDFLKFLRKFKLNSEHITIYLKEDKLNVSIKGSWLETILFEVPILAIINEIYYNHTYSYFANGDFLLEEKINYVLDHPFPFSDFGTRRRLSFEWQETVVETLLSKTDNFKGTSNIYLAMKYNIPCIGTMAHEYIMAGQGLDIPLLFSQKYQLQNWLNEYKGKLGIALTDTINIDTFLIDFDVIMANSYTGVRHDSGNPYIWANKMLEHYRKLGIDPKTKTLVFSDALNFEKAYALYETYKNEANIMFGIGTFLTNNFGNVEPLKTVIKLVKLNDKPVAKISDEPIKNMCIDDDFLKVIYKTFSI